MRRADAYDRRRAEFEKLYLRWSGLDQADFAADIAQECRVGS
ncbi:MAG: hypothetical protein ACT4PG_05835 [Panacagrimonas sp.]